MYIFVCFVRYYHPKIEFADLRNLDVPLINYGQILCRFQIPDKHTIGWLFVQFKKKKGRTVSAEN